MNPDSLLRIDVLGLHEPARLICPDGNGCKIERPQALPYLLEYWTVASVARKPKAQVLSKDRIAAPQCRVPVPALAYAPVLQCRRPCT